MSVRVLVDRGAADPFLVTAGVRHSGRRRQRHGSHLPGQGWTASAGSISANRSAGAVWASLDLKPCAARPRVLSASPDRAASLGRTPPQAVAGGSSGQITSSPRRHVHDRITHSHVPHSPPRPRGARPTHLRGDRGRHPRARLPACSRSRHQNARRHSRRQWSGRGGAPSRGPCAWGCPWRRPSPRRPQRGQLALLVPVESWADRIVLPTGAVAQDGVENCVFRVNGDHLDRQAT